MLCCRVMVESASGAKLPAAWCHSVSQLITPLIEFMIFNDPTSTFPLRPVSSHHDVSVSPPAVETLFLFFFKPQKPRGAGSKPDLGCW